MTTDSILWDDPQQGLSVFFIITVLGKDSLTILIKPLAREFVFLEFVLLEITSYPYFIPAKSSVNLTLKSMMTYALIKRNVYR